MPPTSKSTNSPSSTENQTVNSENQMDKRTNTFWLQFTGNVQSKLHWSNEENQEK